MKRLVWIGAILSVVSAGCYVEPPPRQVVVRETVDQYGNVVSTDQYVDGGPPPPARVEVIPVAPYPGAIWVGGYWTHGRRHYFWVPGHYR